MDTASINFDVCFNCAASPVVSFYAEFGQAIGSNCTTTTSADGDCVYNACTDATFTGVSAGTLNLSGGPFDGVALLPSPTDDSYSYEPNSALLPIGQTVTVSATGATVPAFGPESLLFPALATMTSPVAGSTGYNLPTNADLIVTWSGGQAGAAAFFEVVSQPATTNSIFCGWDGSLGTGTVPQAILTGFEGTGAALYFGQLNETSFTAGTYSIEDNATSYQIFNASFQ
jgi:hypothetical protein